MTKISEICDKFLILLSINFCVSLFFKFFLIFVVISCSAFQCNANLRKNSISYEIGTVKELIFDRDIGEIRTDSALSEKNNNNNYAVEVEPISKRRILLHAKNIGATYFRVKDRYDNVMLESTIFVTAKYSEIKRAVKELYPSASVRIRVYGEYIYLLGTVASPKISRGIQDIVEQISGNAENVINKLHIDMPIQVLLKVKIVELSRDIVKSFGVAFDGNSAQLTTEKLTENLTENSTQNSTGFLAGIIAGKISESTKSTMSLIGTSSNWKYSKGKLQVNINDIINILEQESVATTLAEPQLLVLSGGGAATFKSGVSQSYISLTNLTANSHETKKADAGINLTMSATVYSDRLIRIKITQCSLSNFKMSASSGDPSTEERSVTTCVDAANGQTVVIAGALKRSITNSNVKTSLLESLPIIGDFFSKKGINNNELEVLIMITPYIVKPASGNLYFPNHGISKEVIGSDKTNDNVSSYHKNSGISVDYNKHLYKKGGM